MLCRCHMCPTMETSNEAVAACCVFLLARPIRAMSQRSQLFLILALAISHQVNCQDDAAPGQDWDDDSLSPTQLQGLHAKMDANGDGKLSFDEVMAFASGTSKRIATKDIGSILSEIDTSKDGKLSLEEHLNDIHNQAEGGDAEEMKELKHRKTVEGNKFKAADTNGDGLLELDELPSLFYPETHDAVLAVAVRESLRQKDANHDGKLSPKEFWEVDGGESEDVELSEEERDDFGKLDLDGNGFLDETELRLWESGRFHTEEAMKKLFNIADKDNNMHITAEEFSKAREEISASDAQYHLMEWVEHHEL